MMFSDIAWNLVCCTRIWIQYNKKIDYMPTAGTRQLGTHHLHQKILHLNTVEGNKTISEQKERWSRSTMKTTLRHK